MCRHVAWFGAPRTLASVVLEPDHGLLTQSWAPRHQAHGTVNADGWGVGFFADDQPVRWRSDRPLWSDANFAAVAPHLSSGRVIAAVRSATMGMPADTSAAAPFSHHGWLVSHNGRVAPAAVGPSLAAESSCDAALLAARVVADGVDRVGETLAAIAVADPTARLNLLLLSSARLVGTTWGDTLCWQQRDDGVLVASEPDDSPGWQWLADRQLITVDDAGVVITPL